MRMAWAVSINDHMAERESGATRQNATAGPAHTDTRQESFQRTRVRLFRRWADLTSLERVSVRVLLDHFFNW
jgi:hypothetical protein